MKIPRSEIPGFILDAITAAGYDITRVSTDGLTYTKDVKAIWAGEDYDPYFERSAPGDYRDLPQPGRIDFAYWDDSGWTRQTILLGANA